MTLVTNLIGILVLCCLLILGAVLVSPTVRSMRRESYSLQRKQDPAAATIFVNIASYRDTNCSATLEDIFSKAKHPHRVIAAICEQNEPGNTKEKCITDGLEVWKEKNIRMIRLHQKEAKGPMYARAIVNSLYGNEDYFMMIDSHSIFVPGWDDICISQILELQRVHGIKKPLITAYPPDTTEYTSEVRENGHHVCTFNSTDGKYPGVFEATWVSPAGVYRKQLLMAAGFVFTLGSYAYESRLTAAVPHVFNGEEVYMSLQAYLHGFDVFSPRYDIVYHIYNDMNLRNDSGFGGGDWWNDIVTATSEAARQADNVSTAMESLLFAKSEHLNGRTTEQFWKELGWSPSQGKHTRKDYWCGSASSLVIE